MLSGYGGNVMTNEANSSFAICKPKNERNKMEVKFGNLIQPKHSNNPEKPEAEAKINEMMDKLHKAGYVRQENISDGLKDGKFYHVFSLPYQIEFGDDGKEAVEIMTPYSEYMQPLMVVAVINQ